MDKVDLVSAVAKLFRISGYKVETRTRINQKIIAIHAEETQGLVRKSILIDCADYDHAVEIHKLQNDLQVLRSAKESMKDNTIIMHVSRNGYSQDASQYALKNGIEVFSLETLENRLINFASYVEAIESDRMREIILREYQPNKIHFEGGTKRSLNSYKFLNRWLQSDQRWLTLLGDYGVGKSWTLKRFLFLLIEEYKKDPNKNVLPFFIPLQNFTKAFDFENLILRSFQLYQLSGVHLSAFTYLMGKGKIIFLLDSFDEMAQHLTRDIIRGNLLEILNAISSHSRAIMTSRPNYFEGRAERLLLIEEDGQPKWHSLDEKRISHENMISRTISHMLAETQFARINDLTISQRKQLFKIVLGADSPAYKSLSNLFNRFQELENLSQRAVIARLLTTVAETLASANRVTTIEGYPLLPEQLEHLNQAKIFEIVIHNLLFRDDNIGSLTAANRLRFLREFAIYLQRRGQEPFADPKEIRGLVRELFINELRRTDAPEQLLESYYRTCRRHSGLTTEGQFLDSSGSIDFPVDELDLESRVGFSHNSLREFLVSDAFIDFIKNDTHYPRLSSVIVTELVGDFVVLRSEYDDDLINELAESYSRADESKMREIIFKIIFRFIQRDPEKYVSLLGKDSIISNIDLSGLDLSGLPLRNSQIINCILLEVDMRKSDLRNSTFKGAVLEKVMFDEALLKDADFTDAEVISIYVFDEFQTQTSSVLMGRSARQWLYSNEALVYPTNDLNPLLGKPWYEAAREVTRTLEQKIAGSHQDTSLAKGTKLNRRKFATDFVDFLTREGILERRLRSKRGSGWVVVVNSEYRDMLVNFSQKGIISPQLEPFFQKHLPQDERIDLSNNKFSQESS